MTGSRIALVTGGAAGIGLATATALKRDGFDVVIADLKGSPGPEVAADRGFQFLACDVSDAEAIQLMFGGFESLCVLVNNAGFSGETAPLERQTDEMWDQTIGVNLTAPFRTCRLAVPLLRRAGGGAIVNVASVAARIGYENRAPYAASKWGLLGLTATLAREVGRENVRVNAVLPSAVNGPRMEGIIEQFAAAAGIEAEAARDHFRDRNAIRRFIEPEEVAEMIAYLCSDKAASVTGQFIGVDGGFM